MTTFAITFYLNSYTFDVIYSDKLKEPLSLIISTFCLGVLLIFPAGILNEMLIGDNDDYSFLAGFTEETLKFLALFFYVRGRKEFDEPMDAIVYGCLISLGFATYENYEYVYLIEFEISGLDVAIIRALSAILSWLLWDYNGLLFYIFSF